MKTFCYRITSLTDSEESGTLVSTLEQNPGFLIEPANFRHLRRHTHPLRFAAKLGPQYSNIP